MNRLDELMTPEPEDFPTGYPNAHAITRNALRRQFAEPIRELREENERLNATVAAYRLELSVAFEQRDALLAALESEVRHCPGCGGSGQLEPYCHRCADSTDDHICHSSKPCNRCAASRAAIDRAKGGAE